MKEPWLARCLLIAGIPAIAVGGFVTSMTAAKGAEGLPMVLLFVLMVGLLADLLLYSGQQK